MSFRNAGIAVAMLVAMPLNAPAQRQFSPTTSNSCSFDYCGPNPGEFIIRSYQGSKRCLDYTPETTGSTVFLNSCSVAHPVVIEELNDGKHTVVLHAGTKIIGTRRLLLPALDKLSFTNTSTTSSPRLSAGETRLELQDAVPSTLFSLLYSYDRNFALDGDSIVLTSTRTGTGTEQVVKVQNARGAVGSPLVVGPRDVKDSEFWDFLPTDGVSVPTTGFHSVGNVDDLLRVVGGIQQRALSSGGAWGEVIQVAAGASLDLGCCPALIDSGGNLRDLSLPRGVTLRGDRRGINLGPELYYSQQLAEPMVLLAGERIRITGLRLRGPTRDRWALARYPDGIVTHDNQPAIIDHNDLSDWPDATINVLGPSGTSTCPAMDDYGRPLTPNPLDNIRVLSNFMHHNQAWGGGYGTVMSAGANATINGNTFLRNRHAIADDGASLSGYVAWNNLVLSDVPTWYDGIFEFDPHGPQQDFDMHGAGPGADSHHFGGIAGRFVDIGWNTFLGGNRDNFELRGYPCTTPDQPDFFHNNRTQDDASDAVLARRGDWIYGINQEGDLFTGGPILLVILGNEYKINDPSSRLGVGDFDGDGIQDLFLATRTSWFFSPGGSAEWRFLAGGRTDAIETLRFGDFDGDGRTDVIGKNGNNIMVSWGGVSDWEILNTTSAPLTDIAVGHFTSPEYDDIFYADGATWYLAVGGKGVFTPVNTSNFRVKDLGFGDFDGDGLTDVFGVSGGNWSYSRSARGGWAALRPALTDTAAGLTIADFDGDGISDIATSELYLVFTDPWWNWRWSKGGRTDWAILHPGNNVALNQLPGIGKFNGNNESDVLIWSGNDLSILVGGSGSPQPHSRQAMR